MVVDDDALLDRAELSLAAIRRRTGAGLQLGPQLLYRSARSSRASYQDSKIFRKIHWVQR